MSDTRAPPGPQRNGLRAHRRAAGTGRADRLGGDRRRHLVAGGTDTGRLLRRAGRRLGCAGGLGGARAAPNAAAGGGQRRRCGGRHRGGGVWARDRPARRCGRSPPDHRGVRHGRPGDRHSHRERSVVGPGESGPADVSCHAAAPARRRDVWPSGRLRPGVGLRRADGGPAGAVHRANQPSDPP